MEYRKYAPIWNRYLPVIRILLKKSLQGEQVLSLDKGDFEKVGIRKAGYKFRIEFLNGRVNNRISESEIATDLSITMLENEGIRNILIAGEFAIELNTRFQLKISTPNQSKAEELPEAEQPPIAPEAV